MVTPDSRSPGQVSNPLRLVGCGHLNVFLRFLSIQKETNLLCCSHDLLASAQELLNLDSLVVLLFSSPADKECAKPLK